MIGKTVGALVWAILLKIDGIIYNLISYVFEIFYFLCGLQLFTDSDYAEIVNKVYLVLGLVMMFVLAYSLLKAVIDPDAFAKGENSFPKLIKNVIVSLIIIVVLPTVFNVAFSFQNSLLNYDVIPQLILGTDDGAVDGVPSIDGAPGGRAIAYYTFKSFLVPNTYDDICGDLDEDKCRDNIKANDGLGAHNGDTLTSTDDLVFKGDTDFVKYSTYSEAVRDDELTYYFPISTVAGIFILYVLLNFCFDMALRVVKLAFYQIIAPIPVICRIIPGGKLKDVFSKWVKQVISLFVEVFVRIGALTFGVYLIGKIVKAFSKGLPGIESLGRAGQKTIVLALLIMSVIIFVKQIPKIIGDMFGLDTGGMKLGLMDKLTQGGFFGVANAVGSLVTSRGNLAAAYRGWKHGMNNANFHNIGGEANRRRAYKDARAQGVTRTEIFKDRMRRMFGFESSNKADDYNIENRVFTVRDQNGNLIELNATNVKSLETEKFENNTRIAEINSSTSEQRDISAENATVISARGTFKSDGLEEIHKADSKILEKLDIKYTENQRKFDLQKLDEAYSDRTLTKEEKDAYDAKRAEIMAKTTFMSLVGNYNSLKAQLEQNYQKGIISDEAYNQAALDLADVEKSMQEKFVTAASHEFGNRIYTNYDGSTIEVDDGGKFNTNYQKLVNDLSAGVLRDAQGGTITLDSFVDSNGNQLEGWDLINAVFKRASGINNEIAVEINNSEREKRTIEQANKAIDAIFEQRTKLREQAKNENKYKVRKATSEYNDSNTPKK